MLLWVPRGLAYAHNGPFICSCPQPPLDADCTLPWPWGSLLLDDQGATSGWPQSVLEKGSNGTTCPSFLTVLQLSCTQYRSGENASIHHSMSPFLAWTGGHLYLTSQNSQKHFLQPLLATWPDSASGICVGCKDTNATVPSLCSSLPWTLPYPLRSSFFFNNSTYAINYLKMVPPQLIRHIQMYPFGLGRIQHGVTILWEHWVWYFRRIVSLRAYDLG